MFPRRPAALAAGASAPAHELPAGARERGEGCAAARLEGGWGGNQGWRAPWFVEFTCLHPASGRLRTPPGSVVQAAPPRPDGLRASIGDVECDLQVTSDLALPLPHQFAFA